MLYQSLILVSVKTVKKINILIYFIPKTMYDGVRASQVVFDEYGEGDRGEKTIIV